LLQKEQIMTQPTTAVPEVERIVIESMGERCLNGEQIWEMLDAKGIQATPGVIHLALTELARSEGCPEEADSQSTPPAHGLTRHDLAIIGDLAKKVGGVQELRRLLKLVERIPKGQ
jgi:hypothetical protein